MTGPLFSKDEVDAIRIIIREELALAQKIEPAKVEKVPTKDVTPKKSITARVISSLKR